MFLSGLSKRNLSFVILLALLPTAIKVGYYPGYIGSDDSYIHLQVARTLLTSGTWGIAPGIRCNLSTSPLFTLLLTGMQILFRSHVVIAMQVLSCIASAAGLLAIFFRIYRTTAGNLAAAYFGMGSAAISCNLWRWNGTVMEASFAFCAVALVLLLCSSRQLTRGTGIALGVLLGFSSLLRPELFGLALVCLFFVTLSVSTSDRAVLFVRILPGILLPAMFWLLFSHCYFHELLPTTFYAKTSSHLILWNSLVLKEYAKLIAFSLLWPVLLLACCLIFLCKQGTRGFSAQLLLPICSYLFFASYYYLFLDGLASTGRYLLPCFPLFCVAAAEIFARAMQQRPGIPWTRLCYLALVLHGMTSIGLNARLIAPALSSFQGQYVAAMRKAADYLASHNPEGRTVLVVADIGALSYWDDYRFRIADGGALASPELGGKSTQEQIARVHPALVLQSQGVYADEWAGQYGNLMPLWNMAYSGTGITISDKLFVNIYGTAEPINAPRRPGQQK